MDIVWHGHHKYFLISALPSLAERIEEIKILKPKCEHELRLRLIKLVKGKLPREVVRAGKRLVEPRVIYDKTWVAWEKAYKANLPAIEALHAKECPDCPWNGKSIFPNKGDKK